MVYGKYLIGVRRKFGIFRAGTNNGLAFEKLFAILSLSLRNGCPFRLGENGSLSSRLSVWEERFAQPAPLERNYGSWEKVGEGNSFLSEGEQMEKAPDKTARGEKKRMA